MIIELELQHAGNYQYERGCRGKRPLLSMEEAKRAARAMKRQFKKAFDAYECRYCGHFHCGSRRKSLKRIHTDGDISVDAHTFFRSRLDAPTSSPRKPLGEGIFNGLHRE